MKKLLVFLTDPLAAFHAKGEIRTRYYNPSNFFSEVHFVSPASREINADAVQRLVGDARLVVHAMGPMYYGSACLPFGPVAALLKQVRPDVLRAYDPGIRGSLAVYWGRRTGVPTLISVHADLDEQRHNERRVVHRLRTVFESYALPRADVVMCVSHHAAQYARRHGAGHPVVIYNRVYTDQFAPTADRPALEGGAVTILSVGRCVRPKYQECLIRAVQGLPARLILIGDGPLRPSLERLAADLGMSDRVEFRPSVPHSEIADCYRRADIFAVATHYEGFCIPVLEAMAAGLPIVGSRIGAIEEIVGDAGLLVDNHPEAFAVALRRLVADAAMRRDMGATAAARARTMDGHVMEARERDLYASLCASAVESSGECGSSRVSRMA